MENTEYSEYYADECIGVWNSDATMPWYRYGKYLIEISGSGKDGYSVMRIHKEPFRFGEFSIGLGVVYHDISDLRKAFGYPKELDF